MKMVAGPEVEDDIDQENDIGGETESLQCERMFIFRMFGRRRRYLVRRRLVRRRPQRSRQMLKNRIRIVDWVEGDLHRVDAECHQQHNDHKDVPTHPVQRHWRIHPSFKMRSYIYIYIYIYMNGLSSISRGVQSTYKESHTRVKEARRELKFSFLKEWSLHIFEYFL